MNESKAIVKKRPPCPFYGFYLSDMGILTYQRGNQCALIQYAFAPCQMEYKEEKEPDWNECLLNNDENEETIDRIINIGLIFPPKEFLPEDKVSEKGTKISQTSMPMRVWIAYIMGSGLDKSEKK